MSQQAKRPFSSFHVLSFDIYGTLIDWESGIHDALQPLRSRLPEGNPLKNDMLALGELFNKHERRIQAESPGLTYDCVLRDAYIGLARELNVLPADETSATQEGVTFAESIGHWPAFADTVAAMRKLKTFGYILVPLSNVDRTSFGKTLSGPLAGLKAPFSSDELATSPALPNGAKITPDAPLDPFFNAVYTAQDIGSYKPSLSNFEYLISHIEKDFGVAKNEILHVAQSLFHDHAPAKKIGLESVWIARGEDGKSGMGGKLEEFAAQNQISFGWRYSSLGEFADAVESELRELNKQGHR